MLSFISPPTEYIASFIFQSTKIYTSPILQVQHLQLEHDSIWIDKFNASNGK